MAVKKVDLYVTQLIEDLNNGLTWNKKDDLGYGSIEVKYGANEKQIAAIRKHPLLKDAETNIVIFNVIDDTKTTTTKTTEPDIVPMADLRTKTNVSEELEAFANL
jgi:basic membrane lipoprotein Med (substrate-binding protein (PBP1-ABC) superfamily)